MMKCNDIRNLLSAYADGETDLRQTAEVEDHLESCPACRAKLNTYRNTASLMRSLVAVPVEHKPAVEVIRNIQEKAQPKAGNRWRQPILVTAAIVIALAVFIPLQVLGVFQDTEAIMAKAEAALSELQSFRVSSNVTNTSDLTDGQPVDAFYYFGEFNGLNDYHMYIKMFPNRMMEETIVSDGIYYARGRVEQQRTEEQIRNEYPDEGLQLFLDDFIAEIKADGSDVIDGVDCYHYTGIRDNDKWWASLEERLIEIQETSWEPLGQSLDDETVEVLKESFKKSLEATKDRAMKNIMTVDFWIDKDDYYIRQIVMTIITEDDMFNTVTDQITTYYDFNEPIDIQAPLTETGELLPGWNIFTDDNFYTP